MREVLLMKKLSLTRERLVKMYIDSLQEGQLPWRSRWINGININGNTKIAYKGVNQLLLSLVSANEHYRDPRWFTYVQVQSKGYKLKNAKGKGVPVEFWYVYDLKNKRKVDFSEYEKIIESKPEEKENYRVSWKCTFVYNAAHIEGLPEISTNKSMKKVEIPKFISNIIKNLGVKYNEYGNRAFYRPSTDEIFLPPKENFIDKYSYYATQLHELCHSTGNEKRLNRNLCNGNEKDYAREELIAEISSSFLMQTLNVDVGAEHYDNHKAYIKSWIDILEDKPNELFTAINESNKVCDYIEQIGKIKKRSLER